ncbi:class I SAM-dependent methyltransferase [Kribbella sp. NBC_01505]|uniref:class I SAM-dependent methyltransferase n=1 Tax=Kribbella sp. NBC_01505 TaxID=2903580 RepID=UPI00386AE95D
MDVASGNAGQLQAWDTGEGVFWAEEAVLFEECLQRYDDALLRAAGIRNGEQVLDLGCGTGSSTRAAGWLAGSGSALGVDLSAPMLKVATQRARATGVRNATFLQADAEVHAFEPAAYDVLISRTGCTFFANPVAAFTNLFRALRPGGRVALLVWQAPATNPWFTELTTALAVGRPLATPPPDAPSPFAFADPARVTTILTTAGFAEPQYQPLQEPMSWGPDLPTAERLALGILDWLIDPTTKPQALSNLRQVLHSHRSDSGVTFPSTTWLITTQKP